MLEIDFNPQRQHANQLQVSGNMTMRKQDCIDPAEEVPIALIHCGSTDRRSRLLVRRDKKGVFSKRKTENSRSGIVNICSAEDM